MIGLQHPKNTLFSKKNSKIFGPTAQKTPKSPRIVKNTPTTKKYPQNFTPPPPLINTPTTTSINQFYFPHSSTSQNSRALLRGGVFGRVFTFNFLPFADKSRYLFLICFLLAFYLLYMFPLYLVALCCAVVVGCGFVACYDLRLFMWGKWLLQMWFIPVGYCGGGSCC